MATAVLTCTNCNAELLPNARFCHICAAPVLRGGDAVEQSPEGRSARQWLGRIAFIVLLFLNVALVVLAVLVFGFGFLVES